MYDVVIMGAGVAGCATAIALKNHNKHLKIAILERGSSENTTRRIGETLPPQASFQLQKLGIWEAFQHSNFMPSFGTSSVWGSSKRYTNEYIYSPYGCGWNLDRTLFDQLLIEEAQQRGVTFFFNTSCISTHQEATNWQLTCIENQQEKTRSSRFIVDATGKKASFSNTVGAHKIIDDTMVGIYQFYEKTTQNAAIQKGTLVETDATGWWYSSTLPNQKLVVGYMTDADIANQLKLKNKAAFNAQLQKAKHTSKRIQDQEAITAIQIVAAQSQYLSKTAGEAWLAVGDAGSSYDPIASMGIYKALVMSQFAAFAIADYLQGNPTGLAKYQHIINQDYQQYQTKKATYYNQEQRFSNSLFWQRRQKVQ